MQTCLQLNCNLELADRIELSGSDLAAVGFSFRVSFRVTQNKLNSSPEHSATSRQDLPLDSSNKQQIKAKKIN